VAARTVLITGGLGFVGSSLAHRCVADGDDVSILDNLDAHSGGNRFNLAGIEKSVDLHLGDVRDVDPLRRLVYGKDLIFHCAAVTSHTYSMREPGLYTDVNVRGTLNLLEAIRSVNPGCRLVHIGTSTQIGPLRFSPATEDHPEYPADIYSASKTAAEKYVYIFARSFGLRATMIRLCNVFGPRAAIHSPEFTFNNYFLGQALQNRDIHVFGKGVQLRNVLFIDDAVEALIQASGSEKAIGEVFFATGDEHYTISQIAEETVRHARAGRVAYVPWPEERRSVEIGDAILSNSKIKSVLPWTPSVSLEIGLDKACAYFREHLKAYVR
jgi:UDP-glucose 4-epimerase